MGEQELHADESASSYAARVKRHMKEQRGSSKLKLHGVIGRARVRCGNAAKRAV